MRFIAQHTSIPVPKVYCAFTRHGWTYILMERIDGQMVGRHWLRRSPESKARILSQLRQFVQEMRSIPPPSMNVTNVDSGSLVDCRLPAPIRFGPFKNIEEFHNHLRQGIQYHPDFNPEVIELINLHDRAWDPPVFTHGDLSSLNILVHGDKVVGIIDWETAGWLPTYWEYTTACQVNPRNYFWRDEIDKFLDPMPAELAMEKIRQKYFGDF
jgi:aminoglycoside phosphotransferase (APT) family kinase protein